MLVARAPTAVCVSHKVHHVSSRKVHRQCANGVATRKTRTPPSITSSPTPRTRVITCASEQQTGFGAGVASSTSNNQNPLDDHVPVDRLYDGLRQLHQSPDVFLVDDFLTSDECDSIIESAKQKGMTQSPVVYAGWSNDVSDIVATASQGPAIWAAAIGMLATAQQSGPGLNVLGFGAATFAAVVAVAGLGACAYVKYQEQQLQCMRTSTSCVLSGQSIGEVAYIKNAQRLMPNSTFKNFEAPTVIRYEKGQRLAPHFDANRGADVEDANRGGQTLVTLLLYLNDVDDTLSGGATKFGKLNPSLTVAPRKGQCLVFFPATKDGTFDQRVEHEGTETTAEKWICRIWRHEKRVEPPFGLPESWGG